MATSGGRLRDPLWARFAIAAGLVLMLVSVVALAGGAVLSARYSGSVNQENLLPPAEDKRTEIDRARPLNLLLVGIDQRPDSPDPIRGDTIIVVHIPAGHDRAYLLSLPRDLRVEIPASPPQRERAGRDRINSAFPFGAENGGGLPGGFQLLSRTVTNLMGITFDGAAVINFDGFRSVVRELGGVTMCLDHRIVSEHMGDGPDGKYLHPRDGGRPWTYQPGCQKLDDQQSLDVVRQRKSLPDGDYGRQRNQQRFLKAMLQQAKSSGILTDPRRLDAVVRAAGAALTFDGQGVSPVDWAWSLRDLSETSLVMVRTPATSVGEGGGYLGEELDPLGTELFAALAAGTVDQFVAGHPEVINPP
jgi:LCP family protein required for cell wall assembly